MEKKFMEE
jgi:uncharacterized protein (DUF3084 family)